MTCFYSVIQYIPNPIADERVNIAVLVYNDDGKWQVRTLRSWDRAEKFTGIPAENLRVHLHDLEEYIVAAESPVAAVDAARERLTHSVQLSAPRLSTRSIEEVIDSASEDLLVEIAVP